MHSIKTTYNIVAPERDLLYTLLRETNVVDIARPEIKRKKRIRRIIYGAIGLVVIVVITVALTRLKPAAPSVDKATIYTDTVQRGEMVLDVSGIGDLEPETIWTVSSTVDGRVVKRNMLPGQKVKADSVILELSNPKLEEQTQSDKSALEAAKSSYAQTKATIDTTLVTDEGGVATAEKTYQEMEMQRKANQQLFEAGLISPLQNQTSTMDAENDKKQLDMAQQQLETFKTSMPDQLAVQQSAIDRAQSTYDQDKQQLADLKVRPGIDGVLQELESPAADYGNYAAAGTLLAKVVQPSKLKAVLKVSETQAGEILIGQKASIDTHNGFIPGHVTRIDPSDVNGTRTVDVQLDGPLPDGAVPALSVEGKITIERLENVLYVGRPIHGDADSPVGLFKLIDGGSEAVRVQVHIGKESVDKAQILSGLNVGDTVILSDMSADDSYDRVELK